MKKLLFTLPLLLLFSGLFANENEPSISDLMKAMNVHYYERTLPKEFKEGEYVYLSLLYANGKTRQLVGTNGLKPNEKVKIFVFPKADDPYVTLMTFDGKSSYSSSGLPVDIAFSSSHKFEGEAQDYMIRFSANGHFLAGSLPQDDCIDLIITTNAKDTSQSE